MYSPSNVEDGNRHAPDDPFFLKELSEAIKGFEFIGYIDRGGMGVVYKARQLSLNRIVAIKLLALDEARKPNFVERFKREAEALGKLNHPHIVSVHDCGEAAGRYLYYVMEYVSGSNLRQFMRHGANKGRLMTVISQICDALQYAHEHGVVHRDVKPANILIDENGNVKVADFGLAKVLRLDGPQEMVTSPSETLGTPDYIAPEALQGDKAVDHRADIYSLGVLLYEMLTGHLPKGAWEPPSRCGADSRLDKVVERALQLDPKKRFQQIHELTSVIRSMIPPQGSLQVKFSKPLLTPPSDLVVVDSSSPTIRLERTARSPARLWMVGILVTLLAAGAALWPGHGKWPWWLGDAPAKKSLHESSAMEKQWALANWVFDHHGMLNAAAMPGNERRMSESGEDDIYNAKDLHKGDFVVWRVSFGDCREFGDQDLAAFVRVAKPAASLSNLNLYGTQISVASLLMLKELKDTLTSLNIQGTSAFSEGSMPILGVFSKLETLVLSPPVSKEAKGKLEKLLPGCTINVRP